LLGQTVLEHTLANAQKITQIHGIIIASPTTDRKRLENIIYRQGRTEIPIKIRFYQETEQHLDVLFKIARENNLDHLATINVCQPLLPAWYASDVLYKYRKDQINEYSISTEDKGLRMDIFPYHIIANIYSSREGPEEQQVLSPIVIAEKDLDTHNIDVYWSAPEIQHHIFEHIMEGLINYDLVDILKEMTDDNIKENTPEQ